MNLTNVNVIAKMRGNYNYNGANMAKHVKIGNNGRKMVGKWRDFHHDTWETLFMTQLESCLNLK